MKTELKFLFYLNFILLLLRKITLLNNKYLTDDSIGKFKDINIDDENNITQF